MSHPHVTSLFFILGPLKPALEMELAFFMRGDWPDEVPLENTGNRISTCQASCTDNGNVILTQTRCQQSSALSQCYASVDTTEVEGGSGQKMFYANAKYELKGLQRLQL